VNACLKTGRFFNKEQHEMENTDPRYAAYLNILKEELVPAMGCTQPIALAMVSGIICDGAKPSCAAKIAFSVEAGLLGFFMFQKDRQFYGGDGIVKKGVENTIATIVRLGRDGMRETDREIIRIMLER
jgi:L-cysteine desulfidase